MNARRPTLNVSELISNSRLSGYQLLILALCALVMFIDGFDTQSIGAAAPKMLPDLGLQLSQFRWVTAAALLGAAIGALSFGQLGDRIGRKKILVTATAIFGAFTLLTAWATSWEELLACRFLAGLGLGGAVPNVVALNSEYAPRRIRALMVTVQWSAFPLGGTLAGFVGGRLIAAFGWKSVFFAGGAAAFAIALLLLMFLPESARYLIAKSAPPARVRKIVDRIVSGLTTAETMFTGSEDRNTRAHVGLLFTEGRAITTLLLWVIFAISFTILVSVPLWVPSLLTRDIGMSAKDAADVAGFNNFGSMLGGVVTGRLIDRFSPYRVLAPFFVLGTIFTAAIGLAGLPVLATMLCSAIGGFCIGGAGAGAVALVTISYPTPLRATGTGWAVSLARFGQVAGALIIGALVAMAWKADAIFAALALPALISALCVIGLAWRKPAIH